MTRRTTPIADNKTSAPKPATNYERLLAVLERNAENAREPELLRRLRDQIRTILERSC
jgi:hypothetical protein